GCCSGRGWPARGVWYSDRVQVEPVVPGLDEQEDEFVSAVEPVGDRFGHGVGLVPDDRVADDPAVVLQGEGDSPGQAEQVLGTQAVGLPSGQRGTDVGMDWRTTDFVDSYIMPPLLSLCQLESHTRRATYSRVP